MPIRGTKNVKPRYIEFPPDLDDQLAAFAAARGETFKAVIVEACRRHLAYPPPPPAPPPPAPPPIPFPDAEPAAKPKGKRK